jgi:UDP-glucose 4-epimerase
MTSITLIVGGGGFIGAALVDELLNHYPRRKIRVLGRSNQPTHPLPPNVEYMRGDASNRTDVAAAMFNVDKIIDLAYSTVPMTSFENPLFDVISNIPSSVNLLQVASEHKLIKYLLVSSGGTVYGQSNTLTINEQHPTNPISPYGISKLLTEKYGTFFYEMYGLPIVIARPSNPYGHNQIGKINQGFIGAAIGKISLNNPITIYGERGTVRDYIHIDDLASGLRLCLDEGKVGHTYNLGTGSGSDNMKILDLIKIHMKRNDIQIIHQNNRPFDVKKNILDSMKAESDFNWKYQTEISEGIERMCNYL